MSSAPHTQCQPGCAQGISALAHYVAMRYAQPLLNLGDSIHSIHLSTEFEAEIKFCDLVEAVNSHATLQARVDELESQLAKSCDDTRFEDSDAGCARAFKAEARVDVLTKALEKVRGYNVDIDAGRINYRPHDHIQVIDEALAAPLERSGGAT